jgi:hypothetical protein
MAIKLQSILYCRISRTNGNCILPVFVVVFYDVASVV